MIWQRSLISEGRSGMSRYEAKVGRLRVLGKRVSGGDWRDWEGAVYVAEGRVGFGIEGGGRC